MTAGLRADIAEQYSLRNEMPERANLGLNDAAGTASFENIEGRYVESVNYQNSEILVTFKGGDNTPGGSALGGAVMVIEPASVADEAANPGNGWVCSWNDNSVQDNWLPAGCRD
ncbi:MAG: pilin [Gammaproteobacteria bacterium]|nr:pilin [Gammaproteobacteria bacterium]